MACKQPKVSGPILREQMVGAQIAENHSVAFAERLPRWETHHLRGDSAHLPYRSFWQKGAYFPSSHRSGGRFSRVNQGSSSGWIGSTRKVVSPARRPAITSAKS